MTRELIIKNIMVNYKKYGVTEQEITELIDSGLAEGMNYDCKTTYLGIQSQINNNEELIASYEEKVEYYNQLKEQWQAISDEYEIQMNNQYAMQLLGANWESDVLSGRASVLEDFKNQYTSI